MASFAVITIDVAPEFHLGPLMIAPARDDGRDRILLGSLARYLREHGLSTEPLWTLGAILTVAGVVGARIYDLILNSGQLTNVSDRVGSYGFAFYGGLVLVAIAMEVYLRRNRMSVSYTNATAVGLAFGYAVGRVGDLIASDLRRLVVAAPGGCGQRCRRGGFVSLYALGRFVMFFSRSDSPVSPLGLRTEQW